MWCNRWINHPKVSHTIPRYDGHKGLQSQLAVWQQAPVHGQQCCHPLLANRTWQGGTEGWRKENTPLANAIDVKKLKLNILVKSWMSCPPFLTWRGWLPHKENQNQLQTPTNKHTPVQQWTNDQWTRTREDENKQSSIHSNDREYEWNKCWLNPTNKLHLKQQWEG